MNDESIHKKAKELLQYWLFRQIEKDDKNWFDEQIELLRTENTTQSLCTAFSLLSRRFTKELLLLSAMDLDAAENCIAGWKPNYWSLLDSGRILFLLKIPGRDSDFTSHFCSLFQTADVSEIISLYRGLPLYPYSANLDTQVEEGLRTNILSVFEAIIHNNPYPKCHFDIKRWNNMVLKALFISCRLAPIYGLDERTNVELTNTLLDFAHERWAANRKVPFEFWRCIGSFINMVELDDLNRVILSGNLIEQQAIALAISVNPNPVTAHILKQIPEITADIETGKLTWDVLQ